MRGSYEDLGHMFSYMTLTPHWCFLVAKMIESFAGMAASFYRREKAA